MFATSKVHGQDTRRFPKLSLLPFYALFLCKFKQNHGSNNTGGGVWFFVVVVFYLFFFLMTNHVLLLIHSTYPNAAAAMVACESCKA